MEFDIEKYLRSIDSEDACGRWEAEELLGSVTHWLTEENQIPSLNESLIWIVSQMGSASSKLLKNRIRIHMQIEGGMSLSFKSRVQNLLRFAFSLTAIWYRCLIEKRLGFSFIAWGEPRFDTSLLKMKISVTLWPRLNVTHYFRQLNFRA